LVLPFLFLSAMIGICIPAFAQIRTEARHAAELASQLVYGELVVVLERGEDWCRIRTEHGYEGYSRTEQLRILEDPAGFQPTGLSVLKNSFRADATKGESFLGLEGSFFWEHPDFPKPEFSLEKLLDITNPSPFEPELMADQALEFQNVPYVWGGKTGLGLDCSGLVQFLFQKQGYSFPRDAWQQAEKGVEVPFSHERPVFRKGDLLFFQNPGKKIHHVAISLGGSRYVHSSEWVRVNSLEPTDKNFQEERRSTLVAARRWEPAQSRTLFQSFLELVGKGDS
jgi:hypothetical protein